MHTKNKNNQWKNKFHAIRSYALPRTKELESELDTTQSNYRSLSLRIAQFESERDITQQQLLKLETSLVEASSRYKRAEQQNEALENQLNQGRQQHQARVAELQSVQAEESVTSEPPAAPAEPQPQAALPLSPPATELRHRRSRWTMLLALIPLLGVASAAAFWSESERTSAAPDFVVPASEQADVALSGKDRQKSSFGMDEVIPARSWGRWGPPLLMEGKSADRTTAKDSFGVPAKELQANLLVLGFDLGHKGADGIMGKLTRQALDEFKLLYFPVAGVDGTPDRSHLAALIKYYADLAREDEKRFRVDSAVLASIRIASLRTGIEFSYLMELAAAESNFDSTAKAFGSSASGMYQFTRDTWFNVVKKHGSNYGLGAYASQVEFYVDRKGWKRPMVRDDEVKKHILDLRHNPRVSSIMAAMLVKDNRAKLLSKLDREPARTDLYLTHFLGVHAAISFLRVLDKNPDRIAGEAFPVAAKNNRNIFHPRRNKPSTVTEVYELFSRKFNTERYRDGGKI